MKSNYFLFCDHAILSQGNKVGLIGIFHKINAKKVPFLFAQMFVGYEVVGVSPEKEISVEMHLKSPEGKLVAEYKESHTVGASGRIGGIIKMGPTVFEQYGDYVAELMVDGESVSTSTLNVIASE